MARSFRALKSVEFEALLPWSRLSRPDNYQQRTDSRTSTSNPPACFQVLQPDVHYPHGSTPCTANAHRVAGSGSSFGPCAVPNLSILSKASAGSKAATRPDRSRGHPPGQMCLALYAPPSHLSINQCIDKSYQHQSNTLLHPSAAQPYPRAITTSPSTLHSQRHVGRLARSTYSTHRSHDCGHGSESFQELSSAPRHHQTPSAGSPWRHTLCRNKLKQFPGLWWPS